MRIIPLQFGRQGLFQTGFQRQRQNGNVRNSVSESVFVCGDADFFLGLFLLLFFFPNEAIAEWKDSDFKQQCFFQK